MKSEFYMHIKILLYVNNINGICSIKAKCIAQYQYIELKTFYCIITKTKNLFQVSAMGASRKGGEEPHYTIFYPIRKRVKKLSAIQRQRKARLV